MLVMGIDSASAQVNGSSANRIMPGCRLWVAEKNESALKQGVCMGIIIGVSYMNNDCAPPEVSNGQKMRVVTRYVDSQPARHHESFAMLAAEAMQKAWPCKQ